MLREIGTMNALRLLLVLLTIGAVLFAGPVSPDYTQQFAKIIEILGRRQTPQWVWLIVGWFLGIASSVVVSVVIGSINGIKDRSKLRRMLYREMAWNYWQLSLMKKRLMTSPSRQQPLIQDNPKDVLEFGALEHAKGKRDVFESLKEVADIEAMYEQFHRSEKLSSEAKRTVFKLNPVLSAFKRRVGKEFSQRILLAVTVSPVNAVIEGIVLDRKKEKGAAV